MKAEQHMVEAELGIGVQPYFVCLSQGCGNERIERRPGISDREWSDMVHAFDKKHPCRSPRKVGSSRNIIIARA